MKFAKLSSVCLVIVSILAVSSFGLSVVKAQNATEMNKGIIALHEGGTILNNAQLDTKRMDQDGTVLIAQSPALWCYTSFGAFPMVVALPPGAACRVNVAFYPYVLYGVAGY